MNLRILKKKCKRAQEILIREHRYRAKHFVLSDGEESIDTPHGMEARFDRQGWLDPGPLKGTPLLLQFGYYGDCDVSLPTDMLDQINLWQHWKPSAADIGEWDAIAPRANANIMNAALSPTPSPQEQK